MPAKQPSIIAWGPDLIIWLQFLSSKIGYLSQCLRVADPKFGSIFASRESLRWMAPTQSKTSACGLQESQEAFDSPLFESKAVHLIQSREPHSFAKLRSWLPPECLWFFSFGQPKDQAQPILSQAPQFQVAPWSSEEAVSVEEPLNLPRPAINQAWTSRLTCHSEESGQGWSPEVLSHATDPYNGHLEPQVWSKRISTELRLFIFAGLREAQWNSGSSLWSRASKRRDFRGLSWFFEHQVFSPSCSRDLDQVCILNSFLKDAGNYNKIYVL